jgi:hypothetical protein
MGPEQVSTGISDRKLRAVDERWPRKTPLDRLNANILKFPARRSLALVA